MFQKAVIKPDQLIKRRGKHGLVKCGPVSELKQWFNENAGKSVKVNFCLFFSLSEVFNS